MLGRLGNAIGNIKMFDDTNNPGKPMISGIVLERNIEPVMVLKEIDFQTTTMDYVLLTWGNAVGYIHPALDDIFNNDSNSPK